MIDAYGDSFFHLVTKLNNPKSVCHKVGLCNGVVSRPTRDVLVGGNRCTWGPSYWCSNSTTANECEVHKITS